MEQEDFNIRDHQLTSKERDFENALRPLNFEDFSGQDKVVDNLRIFVKAARLRGEALDQDRKSTRLNSSHIEESRMPSSA